MSRKFRNEQLKLKQLNAEVQEELDRVKLQREKIFAPIIWKDIPAQGLQIQDLKVPMFEESMKLIEKHFLDEDLLCRNANLSKDPVSVKSFLSIVHFNLKYRQSIALVDVENKKIVGVLILKTVQKNDCGRVFDRVQMIEGDAFREVSRFLGQVTRKLDIYEYFNIDTYLEYVLLCIKKNHRHRGLGYQLMECGLSVARAQQCPIVSGIFVTHKLQKRAEKLGMKILYKLSYLDWKDEDGEMIFPEPGAGNYYCAMMGGEVPPPLPPPPPPKEEVVVVEEKKLTRVERLAQMDKDKSKSQRRTSLLNP
ncbi:uncharacterized protein LOC123311844 [Coccinella septempunctata]|uniref:uncharacterized protein LOC123311844 n=1 Tax=Coccinella septempunctata TaxID=41139 RepID=UPI001D08176A|nr:uncharacterized protein LOC123311844 [Coccinella septempunctata]